MSYQKLKFYRSLIVKNEVPVAIWYAKNNRLYLTPIEIKYLKKWLDSENADLVKEEDVNRLREDLKVIACHAEELDSKNKGLCV
jgi:protein-tyrosine phosphatase